MEKEKFDKPLAKGICTECGRKMRKLKDKYKCLNCWTEVSYGKY